MTDDVVEIQNLRKHFGGVRALDDVSLEIRSGEMHGLLGANGSGKSTLIKILGGYHSPDSGRIKMWGQDVRLPISSPARQGIAIVHQDIGLVSSMTVLENISIGVGFNSRLLQSIDLNAEREKVVAIVDRLGLDMDVDQKVERVNPSQRPMIGILRALRDIGESYHRTLFILDEPTAYLPGNDAEEVLQLVRNMASEGAAVLFVSHRLAEVTRFTDRLTILKDGKLASTLETISSSALEVATIMFGTTMAEFHPPRAPEPAADAEPVLTISNLSGRVLRSFSLELHQGEIVGVSGLMGMGQDEIPYLVAGADNPTGGEVVLSPGRSSGLRRPFALIPSDRLRQGVWAEASISENVALPFLEELGSRFWRSSGAEKRLGERWRNQLRIRSMSSEVHVGTLSGGSQQKVVLARCLNGHPSVLLLHEPTQGVDVASRRDILALINEAVANGSCALVSSGDHDELAAICHRVLILREGRVVRELSGDAVTAKAIASAC